MRWLDGITDSMDMSVSKLRELMHAAVHGVEKNWTRLSDRTELNTCCMSATVLLSVMETCEVIKEKGITQFNLVISLFLKSTSLFFKCGFNILIFTVLGLPLSVWFCGTDTAPHTAHALYLMALLFQNSFI